MQDVKKPTLKMVLAQAMRDDALAAVVIQVALERGMEDLATAPAPANDEHAIVPFRAFQASAKRLRDALKVLSA